MDTREVEASFEVFFFYGLSKSWMCCNPRLGEPKAKECSIWLFGIWCRKWQKHIFIKYNMNNIITSKNYILPSIEAFFFFPLFPPTPFFTIDWSACPTNQSS